MPPSLVARFRQAAAYTSAADPSVTTAVGGAAASTASVGAPACPTCGAPRPGRFCPDCGERRVDPDDYTLRHFAAHAVDQIFNLDGTLWRTLRALVTRPGLLTTEYLAGRRTRYTRPLQLFLLINLAFFLLANAIGTFRWPLAKYAHGEVSAYVFSDTTRVQALAAAKARRERVSDAEFARRFDAASAAQQSVWLLTAPLLAGVLALLYARRRRPYVHHLVFAVHLLSFLLLSLVTTLGGLVAGLTGLVRLARAADPAPGVAAAVDKFVRVVQMESVWGNALLAATAAYLFLALRRVYPERWPWTVARALLLAAVIPMLTNVYRDLLFLITYLSV